MTEFNDLLPNPSEEIKREQKTKKSKFKGLINTVTGGVIGSLLTLTVVSYIDFFPISNENSGMQVTENSGNSKVSGDEITVQKTVANNSSPDSMLIADMVEKASKSIVGIVSMQTQTYDQRNFNQNANSSEKVERGSGTGVVFKIDDKDAYIVTNNHVIEGAQEIEVTVHGGEKTTAELIGSDSLTDLAVIKIDAKYATDTLKFGDSSTLRAGDTVLAIGNPLGLDLSNTVTQGIVSAVNRTIEVATSAGNWGLNVIQTDAAINPGNSGGALVNTSGQVMGINSLKISEDGVEGLGFAIPSNDLVPIINEIMEKGEVERPYIGVGLADMNQIPEMYLQDLPNDVEGGIIVTNVDSNSAAAKAGLQVQDVIISINDTKVKGSDELRKYLYTELEVGDKASFKVYRGSELMTIELTLTSSSSN
ncbi:S1C family serine protease [Niallia oryzisoli]|uniref:S1C family serine protease n=1 Tax=Niallia oryzisoli TaxID=1737571 RepID=UPI003736F0C7